MKAPYKYNSRNWIMPDKEWIEYQHFILGKTYRQMSEEFECDQKTMQYWAKSLNVSWKSLVKEGEVHPPFKVDTENKQGSARFYGVTKEWLSREYVERDKSSNQIAEEIKTSAFAVCNWLKKFGIPLRTDEEKVERHSERMSGDRNPAWIGGISQNYQRRMLEEEKSEMICSWCKTDEDIQVHHIDHNRDNADLSNLIWLCGNCNKLEAQLWILQQSNRAIVNIGDNEINIIFGANPK